MVGIRHLVLVGWAEGTPESIIEEARKVARGLKLAIDGIAELDEGPSVSPEGLEGPYDWALSILFKDEEARDAYLPHPAHRVLADLIGTHQSSLAVFDLEI
jgi:hypothetical protein